MFHVVTGGSGSGKSAFAEQCILDCQGNKRIYIATMYPFDEESHRRIARHRAMRAEKKFTTIERYTDLEHLTIPQGADVLLECMSNLTANEIYQEGGAGDNTVKAILNGIHHLLESQRSFQLWLIFSGYRSEHTGNQRFPACTEHPKGRTEMLYRFCHIPYRTELLYVSV